MSKIARGLEIYRNDGLGYLISEGRHFLRSRAVPFQLEIWLRDKSNFVRYGKVPHPLSIIWLAPTDIEHYVQDIELNRRFDIGKVRAGSWDQKSIPITEWQVYRGLKQRFQDGMDWEETEYYRMACDKIDNEGQAWQCKSASEFLEQRCRYVDKLYNQIKQNGYQRQTELLTDQTTDTSRGTDVTARHMRTHEVSIAIGREGDIMVEAGIHRFCITRLLEIDEIPVQVLVRHRNWQRIRDEIYESGAIPTETDSSHPDLQDVLS